jgi:hypothetical protein
MKNPNFDENGNVLLETVKIENMNDVNAILGKKPLKKYTSTVSYLRPATEHKAVHSPGKTLKQAQLKDRLDSSYTL